MTPRQLRAEGPVCDPARILATLGLLEGAKKQAGGFVVRCPWHDEKNASCSVSRGKDGTIRVRCFSCGATADAIGLWGHVRRETFPEACASLARYAGHYEFAPSPERRAPPPAAPPPPPALSPERYHEIAEALLEGSPLASRGDVVAWLRARGIGGDAEAAGVRALPPAGPARDALFFSMVERFGLADIKAASLEYRGGFSWGEHAALIPWRDRTGRIQVVQRRNLTTGPQKYVMPFGIPQPADPFGAEHFEGACEFIELGGREPVVTFCEGAFDALAARAINRSLAEPMPRVFLAVYSATASSPVWGHFTKGRLVTVAFDADDEGDKAAARFMREHCKGAKGTMRERPANGAKDAGEVLVRRIS